MRQRGSVLEWLWESMQHAERRVIRIMVLASVLLVVMQLSVARDPVQFYMSVAGKVESPPLDYSAPAALNGSGKTMSLTVKASPAAPLRVVQNGKVLGSLDRGVQQVSVQAGKLELDGSSLSAPVRVELNMNNQASSTSIVISPGTVQALTINP